MIRQGQQSINLMQTALTVLYIRDNIGQVERIAK